MITLIRCFASCSVLEMCENVTTLPVTSGIMELFATTQLFKVNFPEISDVVI